MSKYQRLEQSTNASDIGSGSVSAFNHADAFNTSTENVIMLFDDSSGSVGSDSSRNTLSQQRTHPISTQHSRRLYGKNSSEHGKVNVNAGSSSSHSRSRSTSPFTFGHSAIGMSAAAAAATSSIGTTASAEQIALDTDEATSEVPLLHNNNNDYTYEPQLLLQDSNSSSQLSSSNNLYSRQQASHSCICQLPGFSANLKNKATQDAKCKILLAVTLCCIFMIVEFLGGYLAGSLAIMTDAAHLASDCISFIIGLVAIWLGGRPPDRHMSFGYKRMEVMGALISILGIWILTATLIIVAIERLYSNDFDLNATTMMVISGIGILINIVMIFILHGSSLLHGAAAHGHSHAHAHAHSHAPPVAVGVTFGSNSSSSGSYDGGTNATLANGNALKPIQNCDGAQNLNLRAAMIHVIGDLVQSIGVFMASVLIQIYPSAKFADPLCTVLFSFIVIMTTVRLFRESIGILLDAVPPGIAMHNLEHDLCNIEGVKSVHHLNVWSHTSNHSVLMAHLVIDFLADSNTVLQRATQLACGAKYNIKHCTIQIERLT